MLARTGDPAATTNIRLPLAPFSGSSRPRATILPFGNLSRNSGNSSAMEIPLDTHRSDLACRLLAPTDSPVPLVHGPAS